MRRPCPPGRRSATSTCRSPTESAEPFWVDALGFELMARMPPHAAFVAVGGYHHHVGLNTWAGIGAPPPEGARSRPVRGRCCRARASSTRPPSVSPASRTSSGPGGRARARPVEERGASSARDARGRAGARPGALRTVSRGQRAAEPRCPDLLRPREAGVPDAPDDHHGDGRLAVWCRPPMETRSSSSRPTPTRTSAPPYVGHRGWLGVRLDPGSRPTSSRAWWRTRTEVVPPRLLAEADPRRG